MKKRLISLGLTMTLIVSVFAATAPLAHAAVYGPTGFGTNLTWKLDTVSGVLNIDTGSVGATGSMPTNWTGTGAPWYAQRASIKSVMIAAGVTNIGQYAFSGCANLTSVTAPGVTAVGQYAFNGCIGLQDLDMSFSLPAVTSIGNYAFSGCTALATVNLPSSISTIGTGVFTGCVYLANIRIDGGMSNSSFLIDNTFGVLYEIFTEGINTGKEERVIKAPMGLPNSYTGIPATVRTIDPEAFAYSNLQRITIPAAVNNIGLNAFSWSVFLKDATFIGDAPQTLPSGTRGLFDNTANGFVIYYYPYTLRWPVAPATNWRGYTAIAMASYVTLDKATVAIEAGASAQLKATVYPVNSSQVVTWSVTNQSESGVVTVTPEGVVRALKLGWADIAATSARQDGTSVVSPNCRVYIVRRNVPVTGVALNKTQITMTAGSGISETITAVVYPLDATNQEVIWSSSNAGVAYAGPSASPTSLERLIVPVAPGTATITVTTSDGSKRATCNVTVSAAMTFVPVSNITLSTTTVASGAKVNMTDLSTVHPVNATNKTITWSVIEQTTRGITIGSGGTIQFPIVPLGQTGTVTLEATVKNGLFAPPGAGDDENAGIVEAEEPEGVDYTKRFIINIVPFLPVSGITGVPTLAFVHVPLQLTGTINPTGALYDKIEWSHELKDNSAGAYLDPVTGILIADKQGSVTVTAIVRNGRMTTSGTLDDYTQNIVIRVDPFITNTLELLANPGGSVSGGGTRLVARGETITITATPSQGYVFAGWSSTNGGDFADASRLTTQFTMPGNETTVSAFFVYTGISSGGSGNNPVLPAPVHYFTNGNAYIKNSGMSFGHITVRDYQLFSHVTLNGVTLRGNGHYAIPRTNNYTEIILAGGYLDTLNQGQYTLVVHFTDYVSVTAIFTVIGSSQGSQIYTDVPPSAWFYTSIGYVSARGWMTARNSDPGRFRPNENVTQGEVIDAMYMMAGLPTVISQSGQILRGRSAAYEWVLSNGILPVGGTYNLNSSISRQDIALLFRRMVEILNLHYPLIRNAPNFTDQTQIAPIARFAVIDLYKGGVINGRTTSTYVPLGYLTRAECATFMHRFAEAIQEWR